MVYNHLVSIGIDVQSGVYNKYCNYFKLSQY